MSEQSCSTCKWYAENPGGQDGDCRWDEHHAIPYIIEDRLWNVDRHWGRKCKVWERKDDMAPD